MLALGGLLGFEDEAAALVAIDAAGRTRAVEVAEGDVAFKDVVVEARLLARELRLGQPERAGQPLDKQLIIGHLRAAGRLDVPNQLFQPLNSDLS